MPIVGAHLSRHPRRCSSIRHLTPDAKAKASNALQWAVAKARASVYISTAASDASLARELAERLEAVGIHAGNPMIDALPGENVSAELGRALNRADAVIVLVSPDAMKSPGVRHDIQFALGQERFQNRLIPVLAKQTPSDTIPWILHTLQWAKGGVDKVAIQILKTLDLPKTA